MSEARNLAFIHIHRESTSFTVSHLSYKPPDPQGEWLSEENFYKPSHVQRLCGTLFPRLCFYSCARCCTLSHSSTTERGHASKHLYSAALISFPATVFQQRFLWERGRVHNSKVKIWRWKPRPLNPLQCFYKPPFMHTLSLRCCLQTLTKHIRLNCHTLHFCFPNCAIISHEWCSSLTQMPRNILHTEKLFKWAQINDGLSPFFLNYVWLPVCSGTPAAIWLHVSVFPLWGVRLAISACI